jgi:hypothetical protein
MPLVLGLRAPGDGRMVFGEVGYDTGLVPGELRNGITGFGGGGQYNWSSYIHFDTGHADRGNWCAYLFADHQFYTARLRPDLYFGPVVS